MNIHTNIHALYHSILVRRSNFGKSKWAGWPDMHWLARDNDGLVAAMVCGLVLLEPSGLAVQNAEWQVGTLLSLSPW
jgi:hypothetical protein